jgi:hypothetical protein
VASVFIEPMRTDAERETYRAERAKLERDPNAIGISWRARLGFRRDREIDRQKELTAAIDRIMSEGGVALGTVSDRARDERLKEIEAELDKFRDRFDGERLALETARDAAVNAALAKEREGARLAVGGDGQGGGPVRLTDLFGPSPRGSLGAEEAAARVGRQRAALQRFVEQSVLDAVRDAAQVRSIDVKVVREHPGGANEGSSGAGVGGRVDMTSDFATWIRDGGKSSVAVGGGRV